jgi:thiamine transport system ATP-binding protein
MTRAHSSGLAAENVGVRFGAQRVLHDVSLRVPEYETLALLGPSGCGKSTLLRAVAGLEPLSSGRVMWNGVDQVDVPAHRRGFGLMFQDGQLFVHRTVAQNVEYGLRMQKVGKQQRRERVHELLTLMGLDGYQDRSVTALSGGQRQRVALARAMAPQPRLLLLDEPLSALDQDLRQRLALQMRSLLSGTTAILVTHDERDAQMLADRVVRMSEGTIL